MHHRAAEAVEQQHNIQHNSEQHSERETAQTDQNPARGDIAALSVPADTVGRDGDTNFTQGWVVTGLPDETLTVIAQDDSQERINSLIIPELRRDWDHNHGNQNEEADDIQQDRKQEFNHARLPSYSTLITLNTEKRGSANDYLVRTLKTTLIDISL